MLIIQSLEKVRSNLNVSDREKSLTPLKITTDFNRDNVTRKKKLLKNSEHVDHKDTNLGREDFKHISKFELFAKKEVTICKKEVLTKSIQIVTASANMQVKTDQKLLYENFVQNFLIQIKVLQEQWKKSTRSSTKLYEKNELQQQPLQSGRPLMLGDLDGMVIFRITRGYDFL